MRLQTMIEELPLTWWPALMDCDKAALHVNDLAALNVWLSEHPQYWDAISSAPEGYLGVFNGQPRHMLRYEFRLN